MVIIFKTGFEGLMAIALVPLFNSALGNSLEGGIVNNFFGLLTYLKNYVNVENSLILSFILLGIIVVLKAAFSIIFYYLQYLILSHYEKNIVNNLFNKYVNLNWIYFSRLRSGEVINTLTGEVVKSRQFIGTNINLLDSIITLIFYTSAAAFISIASTLTTLLFIVLLSFLFLPLLKKIKTYASKLILKNQDIMQIINEFISGLKVVKGSNMEQIAGEIIDEQTIVKKDLMLRAGFLKSLPTAISEPIIIIVIISFILLIKNIGIMSVTSSVAIGFILLRSYQKASVIQVAFAALSETYPSFLLVSRLPETLTNNSEKRTGLKLTEFNNIAFNDIYFNYEKSRNVLTNINFTIKQGEFIGIVGDSGAGKTTLIDLILSLLLPVKGEIKINSIPLNDMNPLNWRSFIGYVPQESILFNDTIFNNITLRRPDISKEDVLWATSITDSESFILNTKNGYDTYVGDRGVKLSGGQRQRIAFARAIVNKPQILLLDEATSSLDSLSEKKIQHAVDDLRNEMTIIVVAHRLSTVLNADRLIVLEKGRMLQSGTPKELLGEDNGKFCKMYNIQMKH